MNLGIAQFEALVDRYGSDLDIWPPAERDAGRALLAASSEARRTLAAATHLAALIRADRPAVSDARMHAILNTALDRIRVEPPGRSEWRFLFSPVLGAGFAAMLLLGWVAGNWTPVPTREAAAAPVVEEGIGTVLGDGQAGIAGLLE